MCKRALFYLSVFFLTIASIIFPAVAFSENPEIETQDQDVQQLDEYLVQDESVVGNVGYTGSRLGIPKKEIPATLEIIDQQTIEQRAYRNNIDAVLGAVGWSGAFSPENGAIFSARGFTGNDIQILHDGTRISNPTMSSRPFNSFHFDRVEVLNGPASVLTGEGAISGTVNYISKTPNPIRHEHQALISYGSFETVRLGLGSGGPTGIKNLSYRVDGSISDSDGYVERTGYRNRQLSGALQLDIRSDLSVTLAGEYFMDDIDSWNGTPLNNGRIDDRVRFEAYNVSDNETKANTHAIKLFVNWNPAGLFEAKNQVYYNGAKRDWRNASAYAYDGDTNMVTIDALGDVRHDQELVGNRLQVVFPQPIFGFANRFLIGTDVSWNDFQRSALFACDGCDENVTFTPVITSATNPSIGTFSSFLSAPVNARTTFTEIATKAVFFEDQFKVFDNLALVGGLRAEWIDVEATVQGSGDRFTNSFEPVSGRAGLVYDIFPTTTAYTQYTTGASPPFPFVMGRSNLPMQTLEKSRQVEVGMRQGIMGKGEVNIALFYIKKKDVLTPVPGSPGVFNQIGKQSSKGIEISGSMRPIPAWFIQGNFSVLSAEFDEFVTRGGASLAGNEPLNVPEALGNLLTSYRLNEFFEFGGAVRYVGRREGDNANTFTLPAYYKLDLYGKITWQQFDLTLRARNVTDETIALWSEQDWGYQQLQLDEPAVFEFLLTFHN